jgi:hypothetical protein
LPASQISSTREKRKNPLKEHRLRFAAGDDIRFRPQVPGLKFPAGNADGVEAMGIALRSAARLQTI